MLDLVLAEWELPAADGDWAERDPSGVRSPSTTRCRAIGGPLRS